MIKVGIVGAGQRCMYFYGPYAMAHPERMRLVALADHDEGRLTSAIEDLGAGISSYSDLDSMLQDPEVQAVIITTPDFTHREMLQKVLNADRHAICEKPMATTLEDAVEVTNSALASPRVVQLGFMLRYAPLFIRLKEIVDSGVIGPLVQVSGSEVVEYYHGAAFFRRWHRYRKYSGGLLVHKACHTLDVINWLVGDRPAWVSASGGTDTFTSKADAATRCRDCSLTGSCPAAYKINGYNWIYPTREEREDLGTHANDLCVYNSDKDSVDNAVMNVGYENGVRMTFSFSTTGARHERHLLLTGQMGHIRASQSDGLIEVRALGKEPHIIALGDDLKGEHGGGDEPLIDSFLRCVESNERPVADVLAGLHSVALGVGATQSIDQGGARIDLRPYLGQISSI